AAPASVHLCMAISLRVVTQARRLRPCLFRDHFADRHSLKILSEPPERVRRPSGLKATQPTLTTPGAPSPSICRPGFRSQARTTLSAVRYWLLPERAGLPSGENATRTTALAWPARRRSSLPVRTSHSRTVPSSLPDSACLPSGANATL